MFLINKIILLNLIKIQTFILHFVYYSLRRTLSLL